MPSITSLKKKRRPSDASSISASVKSFKSAKLPPVPEAVFAGGALDLDAISVVSTTGSSFNHGLMKYFPNRIAFLSLGDAPRYFENDLLEFFDSNPMPTLEQKEDFSALLASKVDADPLMCLSLTLGPNQLQEDTIGLYCNKDRWTTALENSQKLVLSSTEHKEFIKPMVEEAAKKMEKAAKEHHSLSKQLAEYEMTCIQNESVCKRMLYQKNVSEFLTTWLQNISSGKV